MKKMHIFLTMALGAFCVTCDVSALTLDQIKAYEKRIEEQQQQLDEMRRELEAMKVEMGTPQEQEQAATIAKDAEKPKEVKEAEEVRESRFIYRKNENLTLTFSGRLHRMLLGVDDGASTDAFFTDSEQGPTMLRFDATGKVSEDFSIGAAIETGIRQNRPFLVSQDNREAGTDVTVRVAEATLNSAGYGKFSFGRGYASAWLAPEIDLSSTQFASLLPVGMLAPGMKFVNASDNSLSDIQVLTYFVDTERLLLVDRFRYDSPKFGPGLQVSGSLANDDRWDLALRVKPQPFGDWKIVAAGAYLDKPVENTDLRWDGAVSVLHNPTGLNLTVGGSLDKLSAGRDVKTWLVKAGWLAEIFKLGKTAFSIDYYKTSDFRLDADEADSMGIFAVQKWPDYGLDSYLGHRIYDVSRPDIDLKKLNVSVMGVAFNF